MVIYEFGKNEIKEINSISFTRDAEEMKNRLINNTISKMVYQADKPEALLEEDRIIEKYKLDFKPEKVNIVPVEEIF